MLRSDSMVPVDRRVRDALKQYTGELSKWIELLGETRARMAEISAEIHLFDRDAADKLASATIKIDEAMDALRNALNELKIDLMIIRVN